MKDIKIEDTVIARHLFEADVLPDRYRCSVCGALARMVIDQEDGAAWATSLELLYFKGQPVCGEGRAITINNLH